MGHHCAATITLLLGVLCSFALSQSVVTLQLTTQTNRVTSPAAAGLMPIVTSTATPGAINKTAAIPGRGGIKIADGQLKVIAVGYFRTNSATAFKPRLLIQAAFEELSSRPDADVFRPIVTANWTYVDVSAYSPTQVANEVKNMRGMVPDLMDENVGLIIGTPQTCYFEPKVAGVFEKLIISPDCRDARSMSEQDSFPTFIRLAPMASDFSTAVAAVMKSYGWDTVVMIEPDTISNLRRPLLESFYVELRNQGVSVQSVQMPALTMLSRRLFPKTPRAYSNVHSILATTFLKTRVYILVLPVSATAPHILLRMLDRMGLLQTGEYFVFVVYGDDQAQFVPAKIYDYQVAAVSNASYPRTSDRDMIEEFFSPSVRASLQWNRHVITLNRPAPTVNSSTAWGRATAYLDKLGEGVMLGSVPYNASLIRKVQTPVTWRCPPVCFDGQFDNAFGSFGNADPTTEGKIFDSVMIYADAFASVLRNNRDPRNGIELANAIRNRTYTIADGTQVFVNENGSQLGEMQAFYARDKPLTFSPIASVINKNIRFFASAGLNWLFGKIPIGSPKCGFDGLRCVYPVKPDWWKWAVAVAVVATALFAMLFGFYYRQWRYEKELQSLFWKIDSKDLMVQRNAKGDMSSMKSIGSEMVSQMKSTASFRMLQSHLALQDYEKNILKDTKKEIKRQNSFRRNASMRKSKKGSPQDDHPCAAVEDFGLALLKGNFVGLKRIYKNAVNIDRSVSKELKMMRDLKHDNLCVFVGAVHEPPHVLLVLDFNPRGCLKDLLENDVVQLDAMFLSSIVFDIIKGMIFIQSSDLEFHGRLKSTNILVDSRWAIKLSGYGLHLFRAGEKTPDDISDEQLHKGLLWTAPELLRKPGCHGTQKGDVYAFGILLHEIFGRSGTFGGDLTDPIATIESIKNAKPGAEPVRPDLSYVQHAPAYVIKTMEQAWREDPNQRPTFRDVKKWLKPLAHGLKDNIFDNMMAMMEKYTNNLEDIVAERTVQLEEERKKSERLLLMMLPKTVADQLKVGKHVDAETYEAVSIYFSDIVGFTSMSSESSPMQVVAFLNDLYTCFDSVIGNFDVYKVETIGDAYMVVSGLPERNGDNHAGEIATMSLKLLEEIKTFRIRHRPDDRLKLRIGIHSGSCVAGVVGLKMPRYCLFGDTVNTASRMESTGEALKIHCSSQCKAILDSLGGYSAMERGLVDMKGKGQQLTYWIVSDDAATRRIRIGLESQKYPSLRKTIV